MQTWTPPPVTSVVLDNGTCYCLKGSTPLKKKSTPVEELSIEGSMGEFIRIKEYDSDESVYYPIKRIKRFSAVPLVK